MMLYMLLSVILLMAVIAIRRKHYLFGLVVVLVGFYELTGPIINAVFQDSDIPAVGFVGLYRDESVFGFLIAVFIFIVTMAIGYILSGLLLRRKAQHLSAHKNISALFALIVAGFVLAAGIISSYMDAGSARLAVYSGDTLEVPRLYYYGLSMLIVCGIITLFYAQERKWLVVAVLIAIMLPMIHEVFISGRRQSIAPIVVAAILMIIYKRDTSIKYFRLALIAVLALVVFGVQFIVRYEASYGVSAGSGISSILAPQFGEFSAVGMTSLTAWSKYAIGDSTPTYGFHLVYHFLNAVPFLKVGDLLYPGYSLQLDSIYSRLAPYGGLSVLADSILAFGIAGVVLVPLIIGLALRASHERLKVLLENGLSPIFSNIYTLSLLSILAMKYRSGVGDAIQTIVSFSILFMAIISIPYFLARIRV